MKLTTYRRASYEFFRQEFASIPTTARILDVGAGGDRWREFIPHHRVTTLDDQPLPGVDIVADITQGLPFPADGFDVVLLANILEHLPDPFAILRESHRVLKPGGEVIGCVPFLYPIHQAPRDYFRLTSYGLEVMLQKEFSDVKVVPLASPREIYQMLQTILFLDYTRHNFLFRLLWFGQRIINRFLLFLSFTHGVKEYCGGYGFSAVKSV